MINRAKKILIHGRLAISLNPSSSSRSLSFLTQVSLSPSHNFSPFYPLKIHSLFNQRHFFSSNPETFLQTFQSNECFDDKKLEALNLELTHETVVYVLRRLSKDPNKVSRFFKWAVSKHGFEPSSLVYSILLKVYADGNFLKEFWVTIKEMSDKGHYLDVDTYTNISKVFRGLKMDNEVTALKHFYERLSKDNAMESRVLEVVGVIKSGEWGDEVEGKLKDMNIALSDEFVLRVFKELRGKWCLKAYRFFKWVEKSSGFKHNGVTYNGMLRVLFWEDSIEEFWSVFEEMKSAGFEMDIDTYIKTTRNFQKIKLLSDAVRLYEHMMDSSYKPSESECNFLLRSISTYINPDLELCYRVVRKFEEGVHSLTKHIYDGIHRCLTSLGKFDEAEEIVEKMRKNGYEPDNITYSQLVFGLCKCKRFDEAIEVLDDMEEKGCPPDIKTWTILIKGHCANNEIDKALLCFAKMVEKSFEADADLLDVLINGFLGQSRTVEAYKLLTELVTNVRLVPWQLTYKNLIQKLLVERRLEEAMELLRLMKKQNYPPFSEAFVQYISKFGSAEDASEFLRTLSAKEYPTVSAYQHVFKSFFDEGRHSEAKDLLFKCPHHIRKHPAVCSLFGSAA